jgi:hypothetical protein
MPEHAAKVNYCKRYLKTDACFLFPTFDTSQNKNRMKTKRIFSVCISSHRTRIFNVAD